MASFAFRAVCLLLVALALCQGAVAAPDMTPGQQIRETLVEFTGLSDALRIRCEEIIDPVGGFLTLTGVIAPGLGQITFTVSKATTMLTTEPPPTLGDADDEIVDALKEFVRVHQALLGVLIDKSGLLVILSPIRQALLQQEDAVNAFALALIPLIRERADDADAQFSALRETFSKAEAAYELPLGLGLSP